MDDEESMEDILADDERMMFDCHSNKPEAEQNNCANLYGYSSYAAWKKALGL